MSDQNAPNIQHENRLRVMTWNLWWRFGPWRERQPAIMHGLAETNADIVMLQEVFSDDVDGDQAQILADHLGYHVVRSLRSDGSLHRFGNAILSRWPIVDPQMVRFTSLNGELSHRAAILADVETPHGPQAVATTHLEWRYDHSELRQHQLGSMCRAVLDRWGNSWPASDSTRIAPLILGGDLNAVPDSDEIRRLTGLSRPYEPGLIFTDAWAAVSDEPGHTWHRDNPHSIDAQWPRRRLDYLLSAWPRNKPTGNPLRAWRTNPSVDGVVASDHDAVVVEFDTRTPFETERS